jgi:hypothetical protein
MRKEIAQLQKATNIKVKQKSRKRQYIQNKETLMVKKVINLLTKNAGNSCNTGKGLLKRVQAERYYSTYSKTGHNSRTYTAEIEDISDSKGFNE